MKDYIYIGSTPAEEPCAQLGSASGNEMIRECRIFIAQIRRELGPEPEGAQLRIKREDHDFGAYYEVVCYFDADIKSSLEYALKCEAEISVTWDAIAKKELGQG